MIVDDPSIFDLDPREHICDRCRLVHWTPAGEQVCDR